MFYTNEYDAHKRRHNISSKSIVMIRHCGKIIFAINRTLHYVLNFFFSIFLSCYPYIVFRDKMPKWSVRMKMMRTANMRVVKNKPRIVNCIRYFSLCHIPIYVYIRMRLLSGSFFFGKRIFHSFPCFYSFSSPVVLNVHSYTYSYTTCSSLYIYVE